MTDHSNSSSKSISTLIQQMEKGTLIPAEISQYKNYLAAILASRNAEYGKLVAERAKFFTVNRERHKSDAATERSWEATDEGQREIELKYQIRGYEELSKALATNWFLLQNEAKDRY